MSGLLAWASVDSATSPVEWATFCGAFVAVGVGLLLLPNIRSWLRGAGLLCAVAGLTQLLISLPSFPTARGAKFVEFPTARDSNCVRCAGRNYSPFLCSDHHLAPALVCCPLVRFVVDWRCEPLSSAGRAVSGCGDDCGLCRCSSGDVFCLSLCWRTQTVMRTMTSRVGAGLFLCSR